MRQHLLVERAPIGADADGLVVLDRQFDDRGELPVLLFLEADIARIDAILGERLAAGGMIGQELVADVMEIADQRNRNALFSEPFPNMRDGARGLVAVDGDAHQFRARPRQRRDLRDRRVDVGGVGVGHGLHDNRRAAADRHGARAGPDDDAARAMARRGLGGRGRRQGGFGLRNVEGLRRHGSRHFIRSRLRLASRLGEPDWPEGQGGPRGGGEHSKAAARPSRLARRGGGVRQTRGDGAGLVQNRRSPCGFLRQCLKTGKWARPTPASVARRLREARGGQFPRDKRL